MKNLLTLLGIVMLLSGCKKLIENEQEKNFPYHVEARINDKDVNFEANDNGSVYECLTWHDLSGLGDDYDATRGTMFVDPTDEARNMLAVGILKYFPHEPNVTELTALYHTGSFTYGSGQVSPSTINGAVVGYIDSNGKEWSSQLGSQTGSTFNISEIEDIEGVANAKSFRATFTCKLYDEQGNMIPVTSASIRGRVSFQ